VRARNDVYIDRFLQMQVLLTLVDVNPLVLRRRTRQIFDTAWRRLTNLGQLTSATRPTDEYDLDEVVVGGPMCDFQTPNAELTTVLVAGATGRVGRILVRKLQLRGYKVKVCIYPTVQNFPTSNILNIKHHLST